MIYINRRISLFLYFRKDYIIRHILFSFIREVSAASLKQETLNNHIHFIPEATAIARFRCMNLNYIILQQSYADCCVVPLWKSSI